MAQQTDAPPTARPDTPPALVAGVDLPRVLAAALSLSLLLIEAAVIVLVALALGINRLAGVAYPLWSAREAPPAGVARAEAERTESPS